MNKLGVNEIRSLYLKFFQEKEHLKMNSFSLIPENDKSLLLINSGMAPLKPFFTGQEIPPKKRVTTCQKCIRTGDIENVGKTARHGTFFEMLGNFSFGDYFKEDAIKWSWEFFTQVLKLPEEKLYVSIYEDDDETFKIWNEKINLPKEKIVRLGKDDNFWEHGVGPCGPCSEIYFDKGKEYGCDNPNCFVGCDCDRYMEVWNLVFTQFYKEENGTYSNLKNPNIDTGMGLERIATVMQGVNSIFEIDTIKYIRDKICQLAKTEYGKNNKTDVSIRVITDHIRAITFMTADGVLPSNEGRGYVLRRLLRRAVRHGKILGINNLFLADLSNSVIEISKDAYTELEEKKDYIHKVLTTEEERFYATIDNGMEILKSKIDEIKKSDLKKLSGEDAFKLYDTYGFPFDLMKEILEEENIGIDEQGFNSEMQKQKEKARSSREEDNYMGAKETVLNKIDPKIKCDFFGYTNLSLENCKILSIAKDESLVETAKEGDKVKIILDKTPFYSEKGGQVGDKGTLETENALIEVYDCTNFLGNKIIHHCVIKKGEIKLFDTLNANVDATRRLDIARNHTATHLLHKVLKDVLGSHIEQAGSLVSSERLRFDFTHFKAISKEELQEIEKQVNNNIMLAHKVEVKEMGIEDAKKSGAVALFGEKYGDIVRVINVGDFSIELCGGTHISNSAQIGSFKIISEGGISAGVRRIEAVTGYGALEYYNHNENIINQACDTLKTNQKDLLNKLTSTLNENKNLYSEIESLKSKLSKLILEEILQEKQTKNNAEILIKNIPNLDMDTLKNLADEIKATLNSYVVLLTSEYNSKVNFVSVCSEDLIKKGLKAGDIVKLSATICGGGGGGRPNMAQAGGKDPSKINEALEKAQIYIDEKLV